MFRRGVVLFRRPRLLGAAERLLARPAANPRPPKLTELAELHRSGALTDDEYAAAKARLLA